MTRTCAPRKWLSWVRVGLGVLGVALLLLGGTMRDLQLSPILAGAAFVALLTATLIGAVEGWPTRGGRDSQLRAAAWPAAAVVESGRARRAGDLAEDFAESQRAGVAVAIGLARRLAETDTVAAVPPGEAMVLPPLGGRTARRRADSAQGAGTWPSRIGLAIVGLVAATAAQSWFDPGRQFAGGDIVPVEGTAWLGRLFAPWSWSGSDLGGPAANEPNLPFAAVYWLVHALRGSPALSERIWYTALFAGAAAACYLLLRALRIGPAGSTLGALAYVFNAEVVSVGPIRCSSPPWCC